MKRLVLILLLSLNVHASDAPELHAMLNEFLAGATRNDAAAHDRFWALDLIYTSSSGKRMGKLDIMRDVRAEGPTVDPKTIYSAEDVRIQQYGDAAVVAFRLVATPRHGEASRFLNSGTFIRREGKWQVVNWQATKMP